MLKLSLFIDFDGTITVNDVGYELFKHFTHGATEQIVTKYRNGAVNSLTCLSEECRIWNANPPKQADVLDFLDRQRLRDGLPELIEFLRIHDIDHLILSEGFDFYIDHILEKNNLTHMPRITNRASFNDGLIIPTFPYFNLGCRQCSNCKGYHIEKSLKSGEIVVFIGDGHSDLHACAKADIIFARSILAKILDEKKVPYFPFNDFNEIIDSWKSINFEKRLESRAD